MRTLPFSDLFVANAVAEREVSRAARTSDGERLRSMLCEHFDFIWRNLRRLGVPAGDVDDAAQEVFVVAARKISEITIEHERAFLVGTALRVASTFRRRVRRRPEDPAELLDYEASGELDPEELSELSRARPLLQEILDSMSLEQRAVFVLAELEELSAPTIAGLLSIPIGTVHSRLRGARDVFERATRRLSAREQFGGKRS